jgi:hypothetical protein
VLRDSTCFPVHDAGLSLAADGTNHVQQACFPVINMTQDRNNRLSIVAARGGFGLRGFSNLVLGHGFTTDGAVL